MSLFPLNSHFLLIFLPLFFYLQALCYTRKRKESKTLKEEHTMDHFEMVEKLSQKANVTYEEAKATLEKCDWDMLDALVMLEAAGKVKTTPETAARYTTQAQPEPTPVQTSGKQEFVSGLQKLWNFICKLFQKGNANSFTIFRHQEEVVTMPVTVLVLLVVFIWPLSMILLFVGLFCGMRYKFSGPDFGENNAVNHAIEKAADTVQKEQEK